jgi:hypothetical protein
LGSVPDVRSWHNPTSQRFITLRQPQRQTAVFTVHGSLLRTAIEAADPSRLDEATDAVERVMRAQFGDGPVEGPKALIVTAERPR